MISRVPCGAALLALAACGGTEGLVLGLADAGGTDTAPPAQVGGIAFDGGATTSVQGGTTGTSHVDTCPDDQVMTGLRGSVLNAGVILVGSAQVLCSAITVSDGGVTTAPGSELSTWGGDAGTPWVEACPPSEVVVGFHGRSGIALDAIALDCGGLDVGTAASGPSLAVTARGATAQNGGDGGSAYVTPCPSGEVARGASLRSGEWIDAFGLVCAGVSLR